MNTHVRYAVIAAFFSTVIFLTSCGDDSTGSDTEIDLKRAEMLENLGNNVILPSYVALQDAVDNLKEATEAFTTSPSESTLASLQNELKAARLAWQDANLFQFGPAESVVLRTSLNTYPADTDQIESNIESGEYTLGTISNRTAAGFPALDYLLHGVGSTDQEIISMYVDDANASNRLTYLQDVVNLINDKTDTVAEAWATSGDDYLATFLSEDKAGTDVGSSLGELVNAMVLHYEKFIRDGKIGIPAGVRTAEVPRPTATEAYYAGYSVELALANMRAVKRLFLGNSLNGAEGSGLDDNLLHLDAQSLSDEIVTELDEAIGALEGLNDPLSAEVEENQEEVLSAFGEMQDVIVLLKADMTSVLGITITYQDNDGD